MKKSTLFALIILSLIFLSPLQASKEDEYLSKYMKKVQLKIKSQGKWDPPESAKSYLIAAKFAVDLNGEILGDIKFTKSIGDKKAMQAAKEAILRVAPFEKVDRKLTKVTPNIEFKFEYRNSAEADSNPKLDRYFKKYMSELQNKIKRNWHPPKYKKSYLITAQFAIDLNGEILGDLKFTKSISDQKAMQAAKEAILGAAPFQKLDKKLVTESPNIEFDFDYNLRYVDEVDDDGDLPIEIQRKKK